MKKYQIVMQDEMKACGVACIEMILKYYGGYVSRQTLLDMTKTSKDGTTAYNIKETLINLGFEANGIKCKLEDITKDNIILPCIASVIIDNKLKHFVVIFEINFKEEYLIIGDPSDKVRKMSFTDFDEIFNQVLIISFPIKTLPISKNTPKIDFILKLLKPHKKILLNIFLLSIFITFFSIIASFYEQFMLSGLTSYSKFHLLIIFCTFFLIYVLKILSDYFRNKLLAFLNQKLDLTLTLDIYTKIIKLPYCYYKNRKTGDILSRINDLNSVKDAISRVALSLFMDLPLTLISIIILYFINKTLFTVGIIILISYFVIILLFKDPINNLIKKIQIKRSESTSYMIESISGYETIKGINLESDVIDKFEKKYVKFLKDIFKYQNLYFLLNLFKDIINNIGFILIIFVGFILVIDGNMNLGTILTFSSLLIYFMDPIKNIINLDSTLKEAKNALKRILDLVTYEKSPEGKLKKYKDGDIRFKNLNFSYNDRTYILKDVNLSIKKSSKVMVVGKSGSGKSTLFKLLAKHYNVEKDKIFISDIDINNLTLKTIKDNILYIGQNEVLFNDTLYNNLIYSSSNQSQLLTISKICELNSIMDPNLGFNMLIEENGFNLSGGERQRIVLARALLKNFNILIIDEGLSEVDVSQERDILKNIFKYFKDKTIILISHRLDNLDLFDFLVKIENGVVKNERK